MNAPRTALHGQDTTITGSLYVAFELGDRGWKLSLGDGVRSPGCVAIGHCDKIRGPTLMLNTMSEITKTPCKTLPAGIGRVLKRLHYPLDVILLCVRWYVAYSLSLRNLEEMMAERGIEVDHSSVHRWVIKLVPLLEKAFRRHKRPVGRSWRMDETYVKVKGQWKFLYRAVDKEGNTVDFMLRAHRDKAAARRYFEKAIDQNGEPETITVDKSEANLAALQALNAEREIPRSRSGRTNT